MELRLSHAGLVKALLEKLGLSPEEQNRVFDQILDGNVEALAGVRRDNPELEKVLLPMLTLKGQSPGFLKNLKSIVDKDMPDVSPHLDDFLQTVALLETLGCRYQIDIASGAGFEYYTGMIFQLFVGGEKTGGGGRYDALIPTMGGGDIPASGFALYIDRLMNLVKLEKLAGPPPANILVRARPGEAEAAKKAFDIAGSLRKAGYITEFDLDGEETGLKWVIEVQSEAPAFTVVDTVSDRRFEAVDANGVLKLLEGKGGDKDSPA